MCWGAPLSVLNSTEERTLNGAADVILSFTQPQSVFPPTNADGAGTPNNNVADPVAPDMATIWLVPYIPDVPLDAATVDVTAVKTQLLATCPVAPPDKTPDVPDMLVDVQKFVGSAIEAEPLIGVQNPKPFRMLPKAVPI